MDLYAAATDMFDYFDPYAEITQEISSISKLDGRLEGHAKDPITAGLSLDAIIDKNYFGRYWRARFVVWGWRFIASNGIAS